MSDDDLYAELADMQARFERDPENLNIALFRLPPFEVFKRELQPKPSLSQMVVAIAGGEGTIEDALSQASNLGVKLYMMGDDGEPYPKPSGLTHIEWLEHLHHNTRVKLTRGEGYLVSTIFTGITHPLDDEVKLYEVAAFRMPSRELIRNIIHTDDTDHADTIHNYMVHMLEKGEA